jgi:hypothetical protein
LRCIVRMWFTILRPVVTIRTINFNIHYSLFLYSFLLAARCYALAVRNENRDRNSRSVHPYNNQCQVKSVTEYQYLAKHTQVLY